MNTTIEFLKKHWRLVIEIVGALGIIIGILQYMLQQQEFTLAQQQALLSEQQALLAQQQKPQLEYSVNILNSRIDQTVMAENANLLINQYYEKVFENAENKTDINYLELSETILPITTTIPSRTFFAEILIVNTGLETANAVRAVINLDRPITSINIQTSEINSIIEGGVGETSLIVEIDRILANTTATIQIISDNNEYPNLLDTLVLELNSPSITYDERGNIVSIEDISQNKTYYEYDNENRLIMTIDAEGYATSYQYDEQGRVINIISPLGDETQYEYDGVGNLITVTDPSGFQTTYEYDGNSNIKQPIYDSSLTSPDLSLSVLDTFAFFPSIKHIRAQDPNLTLSITSREVAASQINR